MTTEFQYDVLLNHDQADKPWVRQLAERRRTAGRPQYDYDPDEAVTKTGFDRTRPRWR